MWRVRCHPLSRHAGDAGELGLHWLGDPRVGATIRYAPGVLGAGGGGHVGHVVAVYTSGWILSSEMNFYWRGGGAGKVIVAQRYRRAFGPTIMEQRIRSGVKMGLQCQAAGVAVGCNDTA